MKFLLGKPIADDILKRLREALFELEEKPGLAVILIGNDEASKLYVDLKEKKAKEVGIEFYKYILTENDKQEDVLALIKILNDDPDINGVIVQLPLPIRFETEKIISAIDPAKDVDGFSAKEKLLPVFSMAIMKLIESSEENLGGKNAVVVVNSKEFGENMSKVLQKKKISAQWIFSNELEKNLDKIKEADILISAVGKSGIIKGEMLKDGAIVIDGGISKIGKKVLGDVDFSSVREREIFLSPVPGGVGPVTIACLLSNVYLAFKD
jgi:methylenetetrahydrofolate dehydrogenase (NADP+)/methenyltetrahydrofolate cyclohydrolase